MKKNQSICLLKVRLSASALNLRSECGRKRDVWHLTIDEKTVTCPDCIKALAKLHLTK